uniref:F-box domain-containing protein n=1 Tax=Timspurckia oligopyrenoides TaxID=708627 RepID=A0A7S0ZKI6_9RHOD|mmetsp:Transcript_8090/g.14655  ORF Transcript_8090/g.14655 Transcript_8090/m.14655 type:complete len:115 (+) Transcript_8090:228-572(+)
MVVTHASVSMIILPDEVERLILSHVHRVEHIAELRRVCHRWKFLIDENIPLWKSIQFSLPVSNLNMAEKWYRKASRHGNQHAYFLLALLYTYGYTCKCHNYNPSSTRASISSLS